MKRFLILLIAIMVSLPLYAQKGSVTDRFFKKYESDKDFIAIRISGVSLKIISLFVKISSLGHADRKNLMKLIRQSKSMRILVNDDTKEGLSLYKEAATFLGSDFEELMTVHEGDNDIKFMVKEGEHGHISELVMLVGSSDEFVAINLTGNIDLNKIISLIANSVNSEGISKLKNVQKKG